MTVGKLKKYLDDVDNNVEIEGLLLRCENGFAIQSKMRWINNEDIIEELENIKDEIQDLIDFEESCCGNTILGYECLSVINNKISKLKGDAQ